ncbi:hypothetical protein FACS189460_3180 [Deltaproteobacteria bacterium]|nr:hypothetical protein FACS189460_3180 [Deltaproteobacteria bacterium]
MSEKEKKSGKAAAAEAPKKNEGVAGQLIDELSRVHMRIPKYAGMGK